MHWLSILTPFLSPLLLGLGVAAGHLLGSKIKNPTDAERATILAHIADGAAALAVSLNPTAAWGDLLKATIAAIEAAAGLPTSNSAAIERAASSALAKLGRAGA